MIRFLFIVVTIGLLVAGSLWLQQQSLPMVNAARSVERGGAAIAIHAPGVVKELAGSSICGWKWPDGFPKF